MQAIVQEYGNAYEFIFSNLINNLWFQMDRHKIIDNISVNTASMKSNFHAKKCPIMRAVYFTFVYTLKLN